MIRCITFSDFIGCSDYNKRSGKAMNDLADYFNEHKDFRIIKIMKRRCLITNAGNGDEYYELDVIYEDSSLGTQICEGY